jgi:hypothetical protein
VVVLVSAKEKRGEGGFHGTHSTVFNRHNLIKEAKTELGLPTPSQGLIPSYIVAKSLPLKIEPRCRPPDGRGLDLEGVSAGILQTAAESQGEPFHPVEGSGVSEDGPKCHLPDFGTQWRRSFKEPDGDLLDPSTADLVWGSGGVSHDLPGYPFGPAIPAETSPQNEQVAPDRRLVLQNQVSVEDHHVTIDHTTQRQVPTDHAHGPLEGLSGRDSGIACESQSTRVVQDPEGGGPFLGATFLVRHKGLRHNWCRREPG